MATEAVEHGIKAAGAAIEKTTAEIGKKIVGQKAIVERVIMALIAEGHGPDKSAFLSAFFTLVGTHGLHVSLGLAWLVTMKFVALVPLNRIRRMLDRQGIHLPKSTLVRLIEVAAELASSIDGAHWKELRDDTTSVYGREGVRVGRQEELTELVQGARAARAAARQLRAFERET